MERRWSVPALGALVAMLALVVLASGLAPVSGAIPDPGDGSYHACLSKDSGAVKLINFPKVSTCPKGQRLIDWSQAGPQGPAGSGGAQGPGGPQGVPGSPGITKITLTTVTNGDNTIYATSSGIGFARCLEGKLTGGGFFQTTKDLVITDSRPASPTEWQVFANNNTLTNRTLYVYVVCMTTDPGTVIATASKFKVAKKRGK